MLWKSVQVHLLDGIHFLHWSKSWCIQINNNSNKHAQQKKESEMEKIYTAKLQVLYLNCSSGLESSQENAKN